MTITTERPQLDPAGAMAFLAAITSQREWQDDALCAQIGVELFFSDEDRPERNFVEAKAACAMCPVQAQCLVEALSRDDDHGIWGGVGGRHRELLRRGEAPVPKSPLPLTPEQGAAARRLLGAGCPREWVASALHTTVDQLPH